MNKDVMFFLFHIRDSVAAIREYTVEGRDHFMVDRKTRDAVIRHFEIIGEAVKSLPEAFRSKYPDIPWKSIAGFRDVLIHQYFGVDPSIVWATIENQLPGLEAIINGKTDACS